ncbi:hypothetical protein COB64_03470 [Candidatus Wolfebacteria bacterium]|nr:MAG: hypothetical protein COB64_03470 [Candidatus Wolfebacteria bacterium]
MSKPGINEFFDINKFPKEKGILFFPLSISNLDTKQRPEILIQHIVDFIPKVAMPQIGLNFVYSDTLYLHSDELAYVLKQKHMEMIISHRNAIRKLIEKKRMNLQIQHAFSFESWSQLYLGTRDFSDKFREIRKLYERDENLQKYVNEDCTYFGKECSENQINFFLEESLMAYLAVKGKVRFQNDYIEDQQKWILQAYPGFPPKTQVYLFQLNPFKLENPDNFYENAFYDLEKKQLIEYDRVDLETYNLDS